MSPEARAPHRKFVCAGFRSFYFFEVNIARVEVVLLRDVVKHNTDPPDIENLVAIALDLFL